LDLELGSGDLSGWALQWLAHIAAAVGCKPLLYSYPDFMAHSLTHPALAAYPLWYASYQDQAPSAPAPWATYAIWQHTDVASVPGVAGLVDGDVTTLGAEALRALGKQPEGGTVDITQEAVARFSALGVKPNQQGAIFKAYQQRTQAWLAAGKSNALDPTPALRPEWSNGQIARCPFDNGTILEWHASDGLIYQVEEKDRAKVFAECGWGAAA
jgi:hypothetical protein